MQQDDFVRKIRMLSPSKSDFETYDLPEDFVMEVLESYRFHRRVGLDTNGNTSNPLLSLLYNYDCTKFKVGTVSFLERPNETDFYYQVGNVDLDLLILNKTLLNIEVLDHEAPDHIIWKSASNSINFLNAILICVEYFAIKVKGSYKNSDLKTITKSFFLNAVESAGGDDYKDFYEVLLGVNDQF